MFLEIEVKLSIIVHGYDKENKTIEETINEPHYVRKIVLIERIQSISEKYLLVKSSHERIMYWEYNETMDELKQRLLNINIQIA